MNTAEFASALGFKLSPFHIKLLETLDKLDGKPLYIHRSPRISDFKMVPIEGLTDWGLISNCNCNCNCDSKEEPPCS